MQEKLEFSSENIEWISRNVSFNLHERLTMLHNRTKHLREGFREGEFINLIKRCITDELALELAKRFNFDPENGMKLRYHTP